MGARSRTVRASRSQAARKILLEDVALFARAVNPFNRKRFVTICNGMYGRGTYGAVRALTDERFRDRNMEYIQARVRKQRSLLHPHPGNCGEHCDVDS